MSSARRSAGLCQTMLCLCGLALLAPEATAATLLVVNQKDHSLSFIDPVAQKQIATLDVGGITGHEVTVSPDSHTAFVPIYGNSGVGKPGTDGQTIAVIDVPTHKLKRVIDFGHPTRPHLPLFNPSDRQLYVTTELDQALTIIDPVTFKITGKAATGQEQSHMAVFSHDGHLAYTGNVGPGTVSVLDLRTHKVAAIIPISPNAQRISISNDDKLVFTADQTTPRLAVIDTATNKLARWIDLPGIAYGTASTKDGHWLIVALRASHRAAILNLATMKVAHTFDLPGIPTEVLVRPDGKTAYISCGQKVAAIDIATWKVEALIDAGEGADGLAWAE